MTLSEAASALHKHLDNMEVVMVGVATDRIVVYVTKHYRGPTHLMIYQDYPVTFRISDRPRPVRD